MLLTFFLLLAFYPGAQKPPDGSYTYKILWEEFSGKSLGATCIVKIKGDSIKVIHNGNKGVTGKKGDIFDEGVIMKHKKTGKWIIGHSKKDIYADELGGCGSGPTIIDFKKRTWLGC